MKNIGAPTNLTYKGKMMLRENFSIAVIIHSLVAKMIRKVITVRAVVIKMMIIMIKMTINIILSFIIIITIVIIINMFDNGNNDK